MAPLRDATQGKDFLNGGVHFKSLKPSDTSHCERRLCRR